MFARDSRDIRGRPQVTSTRSAHDPRTIRARRRRCYLRGRWSESRAPGASRFVRADRAAGEGDRCEGEGGGGGGEREGGGEGGEEGGGAEGRGGGGSGG